MNLCQRQYLTGHIAFSCTLVPFDVKRGGDGKEVGHPVILLHTISYGKNMITHLLFVGLRLFQLHYIVCYQVASKGTQYEVGGTTGEEEQAWDGVGGGDADFFIITYVCGCMEAYICDGSVKATRWLMILGVVMRLQKFVAICLGAGISLQSIGNVIMNVATCKS